MTIESIFVARKRGEPQMSIDAVRVVLGRGIEGDRNFGKSKHVGQNITFVAAEEIERFRVDSGLPIELSGTRRNVVTRDVPLNDLVGREFMIGDARFRGVELCEPCSRLGVHLRDDTVSSARIIKLFAHRAGLRADVLSTAIIRVGDPIRIEIRME
jgi:MOSC domain-containing protein YiiM